MSSDDDPYTILGVDPGAGEAAIRRRYLELVREFSPERSPERFAAIRRAYDQIRDPITRLRGALFGNDTTDSLRAIALDLRAELAKARLPLETILALAEHP